MSSVRTAAGLVGGLLVAGVMIAIPVGAQVRTTPYFAEPPDNRTPSRPDEPFPYPADLVGVELLKQTEADAHRKSAGCVACHQTVQDPHFKDTLRIGCTDCHGGDACATDKLAAHVPSRFPEVWAGGANPVRSYTILNHESPEFIRFVNPGDLRVAHISCGTSGCHPKEVFTNRKQIMTSGAMLWGAALYNNGTVPYKRARHGEFYSMNGAPLRAQTVPAPTDEELTRRGVVPYLDPLPRFEVSQPGNVLRIFERGGRFRPEVGIPERTEEPGRPRTRISDRGLGTQNRTDPVLVSLNKTRLFDNLNFLGTTDHAGDYRSSGCTACHVVYANDRSSTHSGPYARYGNRGQAGASTDPTISKTQSGHPIEHRFTSGVPTSQCIVCHIHPGTTVMNSYLGYMWWDEETEGHLMYPEHERKLSPQDYVKAQMSNPNEAAARALYSDPEFLTEITQLNDKMSKTQFADFHGHGWVFRAVYKHDRKGRLLDREGNVVERVTPELLQRSSQVAKDVKEMHRTQPGDAKLIAEANARFQEAQKGVPVHLMDIHLEKGMHCVDCHFVQDMHGNGRLHMEVRAACEIQCIDCHGTATKRPTLRTSGPASYTSSVNGGRDLTAMRTPFGKPRFEREGAQVFQNSMVEKGVRWEVKQTADTVDPNHPSYNARAALAKTVRVENGQMIWGDPLNGEHCNYAHANDNMSCIACHSAWNPSCYGCHLPQRANLKMPQLHWDGDVSRNYTPYNFQTLRDDVYMLARDGDATGNRIGPARSSCAIHVGSYNNNRESIYVQQQTISAEGQSGVAFSTNVPHTVRGAGRFETRQCTDCHVSKANDNNAWMAQLLMQGTNYMNFVGRYAWVAAGEHGLAAVEVTERDEPQAVIGSFLHSLAFPERFRAHQKRGGKLKHAHEHPGPDVLTEMFKPLKKHEVLQVQNRGEYLYAACGDAGVRVYDIAFIDDKAFSERITTAPVSPKGQRFYVRTKHAVAVAAPATMAPDPTRTHQPENKEQPIPGLYGNLYVADKFEGLIAVGAATTINGNPLDNFLKREWTFNPEGKLDGATNVTIVGNYAYVTCKEGLVVVSLEDAKCPKVVHEVGEEFLKHPKGVQVQFRYAYCWDEEGIKVLDVTELGHPKPVAKLDLEEVHSVYLARTYAYVAAGHKGLVILDITVPDRPRVDQVFDAGGCINDCHDVKLGITYVSQFAYLADGKNGLRVVQLTSPETPGNDGFSPRPTPKLVATYKLPHEGHAVGVAEGLDRDRAVDESGNQIAVFGRVGARPLNAAEQRKMYLRGHKVWTVSDDPADYPPPRPRSSN
jgi:hypothetical protein